MIMRIVVIACDDCAARDTYNDMSMAEAMRNARQFMGWAFVVYNSRGRTMTACYCPDCKERRHAV